MVATKQLYIDAMKRGGIRRAVRENAACREIPALGSFAIDESPSGAQRPCIPPRAGPKSVRGDGLIVLLLIVWVAVVAFCSWVANGCGG
jgi:hypothetical protein